MEPNPLIALGSRSSEWDIHPLTEEEFHLFQSFIYREAGIFLGPTKKALVFGRLSKRLRQLGLRTFMSYYRRVSGPGSDTAERAYMLDCICTNETHFFRDPRHFDFLEHEVFHEWEAQAGLGKRNRRIKVWSAACSTGEEPVTLAMTLLKHFPQSSGWQAEILATDLSNKVLARAKQAIWPLEKAREIPEEHLKAFMLRGTGPQEGRMKAGPEVRALIEFKRLNLNDDSYAVNGPFDLIFCRNVLIYFDHASKTKVVNRLIAHLAPNGHLFLGSAESLNGVTDALKNVHPSIYRNSPP